MRRRGAGGFGLIFFMIALIIFASGAIVVYTVFMKPERISVVPSFLDKSAVEAVAEAEKLELVVQVEQVASTLPEGRVLAQSPRPGTELRKGKVIVLQVAKGGELHPVPDVSGKSLSDAQAEIKAQGFALGDVVRIHEGNLEPGNVIAQSPAAPANIAAGRKIDLLVQDAGDQNGNVTIPDVNRMSESEARNILSASGLKVSSVNKVYSPIVPEGLAIETQPGAGTAIKSGQGVILKIATQRRPAGYMDADSNTGGKRIVTQSGQSTAATTTTTTTPKAPAQTKAQTPQQAIREATTQTPAPASTQTSRPSAPAPAQTPAPAPAPASTARGTKTARIRYVVPPIARPMNLRIEITDPSGKRDVLNRQVRSGESISTNASYTQECVISIYLGGEFVWQERQK